MRPWILALAVVMATTLVSAPWGQVSAAAPAQSPGKSKIARGGVTISPAFQQVTLAGDKPESVYDFELTNNTDSEYEFALSVVDFGSLDETGGVLFAGNAKKTFNYRYNLSPWVQLEKNRVVVSPRGKEKIPITILNKESLTPGGHYGAILVTPTDGGASGQKVQIDQVATSLLFVKKTGGEIYKLQLNRFSVRPHLLSLPTDVQLRFQNSGNVHVIPRGLVTIADPRGRAVSRGVINQDSGIALPETFRQADVRLLPIARAWIPGRYTITASYRYDESQIIKKQTSNFIYLNLPILLAAIMLVAAASVLAFSRTIRSKLAADARESFMAFKSWLHTLLKN